MESNGEEKKLQTMLRIAQFVLNRQTASFRKELNEFLVGVVFEEYNRDNALNMIEIIKGIEDLLGLSDYPVQPVRDAIDSLLSQGNLIQVSLPEGPKYTLSPQKAQVLRVLSTEYSNLRNTVESELTSRAKSHIGRISVSVRTKLMKSFDYVLGQVSAANSIRITLPGGETDVGILDQTDVTSLKEYIKRAVTLYLRGEKRDKFKTTIEEYIKEQTEALTSYLHSVSAAFYVIQILHLDPECQGLTRDELQNITIYIDTNVIMNVLLGPDFLQSALAELITLLKQQGLTVMFTSETRDEFFAAMRASRKICNQIKITYKRFEKIEPLLDSGFVKDFLSRKAAQSTLTVAGYFRRLEHIDKVMLTKFGVELETENYDELLTHPKYMLLMEILSESTMKPSAVAEHDVIHILLVQKLREGQSCGLLGPRFWFLTLDSSLPRAESMLRGRDWVQSSIQPDQLTQLISPVISPDTTQIELPHLYSALFRTRLMDAGSVLSEEDLLKIQGPWMDYEDLGTDEIREIVGKEHAQHYIQTTPTWATRPQDLSAAFEPVITEMRQQRELDEKRLESERRMNIIKSILMFSFLIIINVILLAILITSSSVEIGLTFWGIIVGIQLCAITCLEKEIRKIFGRSHRSNDSQET